MDWKDDGIVLARRRHGESAAIVSLLTRDHGRHLGLVRGGAGRRAAGVYQQGSLVSATWRGRLAEHLGSYACEPVRGFAARVMDDPLRLGALVSACAIVEAALPEREPHRGLYEASLELLNALEDESWATAYVRWECRCLADLGFGLDLMQCAVTGETGDLAYVSPRSGRAVSRGAGKPYADKLFPLPGVLLEGRAGAAPSLASVVAGLDITGHFLERNVLAAGDRPMPRARIQFVDRLRRSVTIPRL
jgi:DNA repair protein RecO (recombination protein O)